MQITTHRPYPLDTRRWAMAMQWHDLLFAHWPLPPETLRPLLPPGLALETYDGSAWIGVVPFRMAGVRARLLPAIPGARAFPELNVRTYVRHEDRPGVWFFSLDAAHPAAVEVARLSFHLPYFAAMMRCVADGTAVDYRHMRSHSGARPAQFVGRYRPTGPVFQSAPGTIEHWLTERYCLYAANRRGALWRGEIHHAPWPLQPAEAEFAVNQMTAQIGVRLPDTPPLLHFARRLDVVAWLPTRVI